MMWKIITTIISTQLEYITVFNKNKQKHIKSWEEIQRMPTKLVAKLKELTYI